MAPQLRHLLHRRRYRGQHPSVDTSTSRAPKRARKDAINDSVDRLSDLPDTLLCHILSLIDTKYAVATSVLSKRWRHLYISVPNIILDDSLTRKTKKEESVMDFAMFGLGQIIQRNLHPINLFRLKCNLTFDYHAIKTLVCAAIWRNVKELDLCVAKGHGILPLPPEVFTSRSLVVLKLTGDHEAMPLVVPDLVTLPNLKVLHLGALDLDDSVNRLFQGCKLLEDLCLSNCDYDVDVLDFSFPFLRKLSIKNTDKEAWDYIASAGLVIDTPNLEVFEYRVFIGKYIRMKKPMSNGRAEFDFPPSDKDENLLEFIEELRGLKSLYLSETALEAMYPECNCGEFLECIPSPFEAPPFETLTLLKLGAYSLHILPYILECTPQLEVLLIDKLYERKKRIYEYPDPPETAPICLSEHLRNIEFRFQVSSTHQLESDFETMKYLLQNGKVLERMKISITHWWYRQYYTYPRLTHSSIRRAVRQKLKMLPSFSETCKVVFEY